MQKISEMKLLPDNLNIVAKFYDDHCDQSHAMISAMDGHFDSCGDVIFGPVCDYALGNIPIGFLCHMELWTELSDLFQRLWRE